MGKLLLRDRDSKFNASFDEVFKSEGVEIIRPVTGDGSTPRSRARVSRQRRKARTTSPRLLAAACARISH